MDEAARYRVSERLRTGNAILIRAIRPDDKQRLLSHFQGLSTQSVHYRFFGFKRSLDDNDLRRLTELDFVNHVGLAATQGCGQAENFIGVGRYIRKDGASCAEVAFAVLDACQGQGIGTLLLKHLAKVARAHGVRRFAADVMGANQQMLEVFANSGFRKRNFHQSGVVRVIMEIQTRD